MLSVYAGAVVVAAAQERSVDDISQIERRAPEDATTAAPPLFTDVAAHAGIDFLHVSGARGAFWIPEEMGSGGAFLDYDDDGDMDLYLVQGGVIGVSNTDHRNRLYRNVGSGRFDDVSRASDADINGYGMGCVAADYDNDGDIDLYVTRLGPDRLLENNGDGTFSDATERSGLGDDGFGVGAAFLDYDRDGHLDLFVARYLDWSPAIERSCFDRKGRRDYCNPVDYHAQVADRLYHATGGGRFEDVTVQSGIHAARGNGLGVICTDFTGDGWVDIYVANDQTPAFLWVNRHDGTFADESVARGAAFNGKGSAISGMGVAAEDIDADADYDLIVTNIHDQPNLCLRNNGDYFEDASNAWGFGRWGVPYTAFGIGLFDQNHDGAWDCFVANGAVEHMPVLHRPGHDYAEPNIFARRRVDGRFRDASIEAGLSRMPYQMSRSALLADYDNDGDIDVLVTNCGGKPELLRNNNKTQMAWTVLDLVPAGGNRNAINARVELQAGGARYRREVRPHAGYLGSNDPRLHVGLRHARVIDQLTVTWPDRSVETWSRLPVNRHLRLRQGASPRFSGGSARTGR